MSFLTKLRGWAFKEDLNKPIERNSIAVPENLDGSIQTIAGGGGMYGTYVDFEGNLRTQNDLITKYQQMALQPEIKSAIDDIVNEAIVVENGKPAVSINLDEVSNYSKELKKKIQDEFKVILRLLNFRDNGHDIFRRWYIDGRLNYHVIIDEENSSLGIQRLEFIDPRKITKVRDIKKKLDNSGNEIVEAIQEYFVYNEKGLINTSHGSGKRLTKESVTYVHSGISAADGKGNILSHLHIAIKPLNILRMIEDAILIYRVSRAPERRIFYVDIGTLSKQKSEEYLKDIISRYRNKATFDSQTGEIRDDKKYNSMMEDYFIPTREGGKGTRIETLKGAENLGRIEDVEYFQKCLYAALEVPASRLKSDSGFNMGRQAEISREEVKFFKFIERLRMQFNQLFDDLLLKQLRLKGIMTEDEWDEIHQERDFKYVKNSYFAESMEAAQRADRLAQIDQMRPDIGYLWSKEYIWKEIAKLSEDEIKKIKKQIDMEKNDPVIPDQIAAETQSQLDIIQAQAGIQMDTMSHEAGIQAQQAQQAHEYDKVLLSKKPKPTKGK